MNSERLRQIEELYHSARERDPDEREVFLAEACRRDVDLLREVTALLAQDEAGGPMDQPVLQVAVSVLADVSGGAWATGQKVGPYEISILLGQGGMGEVYRARDTRLGRTVAIKIAHEEFSGRFQREARAIAALNHPNICTLYDVGPNYLVMEFVEGETLATHLKKRRLPAELVLRYGAQIADALSAAHSSGITHRDLKPANIMVTKSGIKVLDFGLAKFTHSRDPGAVFDEAASESQAVLGTPAYMAPEQLEGKECDARTDIFAIGLVLYEAAAGSRAFAGDSRAALIGDIMGREPAPLKGVPPQFAHLVERCLSKDPEKRWQSAHDLAAELRWIQGDAGRSSSGLARVGKPVLVAWLLAAICLVSLAVWIGLRIWRVHPDAATVEFSLLPPADSRSFAMDVAVAVSPDGSQLALRAVGPDGRESLWTRPIDSATARPLPGTAGAMGFFWSHDNRSIAFVAGGRLRWIDVRGGPALDVCDFPMNGVQASGTWGRDGSILFAPAGLQGLYRVSRIGAPAERVTTMSVSRHEEHLGPQYLPDDRRFLFTIRSDGGVMGIYLGSLDRRGTKLLIQGASNGYYTRPSGSSAGYILFERNMVLMAQRFDESREEVLGEPVAVSPSTMTYWRAFSASENGVVAYRAGNPDSVIVSMDRAGRQIQTLPVKGDYRQIALSPDESRLAVGKMEASASNVSHIWVMELSRGTITPLTSVPPNDWFPVWSPDGRQLAFTSYRDGPANLYVRDASGAGGDEALLKSELGKAASSWSPDGRYLAYWGAGADTRTKQDIWILPLAGRKPFAFLQTEHNELQAEFSPDGWIAYTSDESGRQEVYVRRFEGAPAEAGAFRISTEGGSHPKWRADGKELFYLSPDRKLMSVAVTSSPVFKAALPRPLFQTRVVMADFLANYAVAANGQRFLVNSPSEEAELGPITVIANWNPGAKR
jgi:serine/threonine protein kinase/Tol biopolymer transport system component